MSAPIRIGFCGASSTGKTTTAKLVAHLLGIPFLPSVARGVYEEWGLTTEKEERVLPQHERAQFQHMIFVRKYWSERTVDAFVSDRTLIDHLVYTRIAKVADADLVDMMRKAIGRYDLVVRFRAGDLPFANDGMRADEPAHRAMVDHMVLDILKQFEVPFVVAPKGTPDQRAEFVANAARKITEERNGDKGRFAPQPREQGAVREQGE